MGYSLTENTPPTIEPLTLSEAKDHLRVGIPDDDEIIKSLIVAARQRCEVEAHRTFPVTGLRLVMDRWDDTHPHRLHHHHGYSEADLVLLPSLCFRQPMLPIELPVPPLISVESITYIDEVGQTQTLDPSTYRVDPYSTPGRIIPLQDWPKLGTNYSGITILFTAGYSTVPASVKNAMKLIIGSLYENRESVAQGQLFEIPTNASYLLAPFKIASVA